MDPLAVIAAGFAALDSLFRYLAIVEANMTPDDRARREKLLKIGDAICDAIENLKPGKEKP